MPMRRFDVKSIREHGRMFIIGLTGSGKTAYLDKVLREMRPRFDLMMGMSPTAETCIMFRKYTHESLIHNRVDLGAIKRIADKARELTDEQPEGVVKRSILLVMDDCLFDQKFLNNEVMKDIFMNGRHNGITMIFLAQYTNLIPRWARSQIWYTCVTACAEPPLRQDLQKNFFPWLPAEAFYAALDHFTQNHGLLISDRSHCKANWQDHIFWDRVDDYVDPKTVPPPTEREKLKTMIGNRNIYKCHARFYVPRAHGETDTPNEAKQALERLRMRKTPHGPTTTGATVPHTNMPPGKHDPKKPKAPVITSRMLQPMKKNQVEGPKLVMQRCDVDGNLLFEDEAGEKVSEHEVPATAGGNCPTSNFTPFPTGPDGQICVTVGRRPSQAPPPTFAQPHSAPTARPQYQYTVPHHPPVPQQKSQYGRGPPVNPPMPPMHHRPPVFPTVAPMQRRMVAACG